jgi:hypothetical protein
MAINQKDSLFNNELIVTNTYLNSSTGGVLNYVRLGVDATERNKLDSYATTQWPAIYSKLIDPAQKTKVVVEQKEELKKEITDFINPLLYRMASSPNVTVEDKEVLQLPKLKRQRTPRPAISTAPNTSITPLEGATLLISNRVDKSSRRDKMHPDCDVLEVAYKIGGSIPVTPQQCPNLYTSMKALFTFKAGMDKDGKKFFAYTRWVNLREPEKTGPWSPMVMGTISAGTPKVIVEE